jgi:modulator of FtsH protease HflK
MRLKGKAFFALALVAVIILVAAGGFYRVGQGEEALVLTLGNVTDTKGPGLYWHIPLIQQVISESVSTIHTKEYGFRTIRQGGAGQAAAYKDDATESVMLTNDNSIVQLEAIYQYSIRDVQEYAFDIDDPEGTLQLAFEAVIRRNIQSRSLDDALLNKEDIEREVLPDFQTLVDSYRMGVRIHGVHIQNITVPGEVTASYEDVNNAKNEKTRRLDEAQRYANEVLPIARSNAYELIQQAEGYKAEVVAKAQAEVAVFSAVYEKYLAAPEVSRTRLLIETMESILESSGKVIVADNGSDVLKILDVTGSENIDAAAAAIGGK